MSTPTVRQKYDEKWSKYCEDATHNRVAWGTAQRPHPDDPSRTQHYFTNTLRSQGEFIEKMIGDNGVFKIVQCKGVGQCKGKGSCRPMQCKEIAVKLKESNPSMRLVNTDGRFVDNIESIASKNLLENKGRPGLLSGLLAKGVISKFGIGNGKGDSLIHGLAFKGDKEAVDPDPIYAGTHWNMQFDRGDPMYTTVVRPIEGYGISHTFVKMFNGSKHIIAEVNPYGSYIEKESWDLREDLEEQPRVVSFDMTQQSAYDPDMIDKAVANGSRFVKTSRTAPTNCYALQEYIDKMGHPGYDKEWEPRPFEALGLLDKLEDEVVPKRDDTLYKKQFEDARDEFECEKESLTNEIKALEAQLADKNTQPAFEPATQPDARRTVQDSSDEDEPAAKPAPKQPAAKDKKRKEPAKCGTCGTEKASSASKCTNSECTKSKKRKKSTGASK